MVEEAEVEVRTSSGAVRRVEMRIERRRVHVHKSGTYRVSLTVLLLKVHDPDGDIHYPACRHRTEPENSEIRALVEAAKTAAAMFPEGK